MRKYLFFPFALFFFYLVMNPVQAASSARDGLILWYSSIVPVLFPFMLLCRLMIQSDIISSIPNTLTKPFRILFRCSHEGSLAIMTGFLCGFPMGARFACDLYQAKKISQQEYTYLLSFVNNLSPGFLISYLAAVQLKHPDLTLPILGMVLGSALLYGFILSRNFRDDSEAAERRIRSSVEASFFSLLDDSIYMSVSNTLRLGGYIVCFSIVSDTLSLLPICHPFLSGAAASIEVTKGIEQICRSRQSFPIQLLLSVSLAAFGGWSAIFQTAGVCQFRTRQFLQYIKSRVIITLLSILLFFIWYSVKIILLNDPLPE